MGKRFLVFGLNKNRVKLVVKIGDFFAFSKFLTGFTTRKTYFSAKVCKRLLTNNIILCLHVLSTQKCDNNWWFLFRPNNPSWTCDIRRLFEAARSCNGSFELQMTRRDDGTMRKNPKNPSFSVAGLDHVDMDLPISSLTSRAASL